MDNGIRRIGDLEIEQDLRIHRLHWRIERIGWLVMLGLVIVAALGLLGRGWLSRGAAGGPGSPLQIEYERFAYLLSPTILRVHVMPEAIRGGRVRIALSRDFTEAMQVNGIHPWPERMEADGGSIVYTFNVGERGLKTALTFDLEPESVGVARGRVGLAGGEALAFNQLVYP